jgi:hypothetical protein
LRNRPALLIETHMFKDYAARVRGTYQMLLSSLALVNQEHAALRAAIDEADTRSASAAFRSQPFPVSVVTSYHDSVMVDFLGFDYTVETSSITGGEWYRYTGTPRTFRIPYFNTARVAETVALPEGYVIPAGWTEAIERVRAHGIRCAVLGQPASIPVRSTRFADATWSGAPFEGRHTLSYRARDFEETRTFPAGSLVVDMAQPLSKVAAHLLEPASADALVRWGYLDASFEQKEYIESYVIEGLIRKMLAEDEELARDFEAARADTAFARDPGRVRRWFYERSPYADLRVGLYPVGRILDRAVLEQLPLDKR